MGKFEKFTEIRILVFAANLGKFSCVMKSSVYAKRAYGCVAASCALPSCFACSPESGEGIGVEAFATKP